jgi:hypothetical protein
MHELSNNNRTVLGKALAVYGGLAVFGAAYNALTGWVERRGFDEGYTSDLVIGGVLVTVAGTAPLVGIRRAAFVLGAFVASGLPMIIGARVRYRKAREMEREGHVNGITEQGAATWERAAPEAGRRADSVSERAKAFTAFGAGRQGVV